MQTRARSFEWLRAMAIAAIGLATTVSLTGCPTTPAPTPKPEGLLLAYQAEANRNAVPSISVAVSTPTAGATWSESTPWNNSAYPSGDVPSAGVGAAVDVNSIGRLVGWVAGGAKTRMRYALGDIWESSFGERAHDFDENALDSAPAIARHSATSWLAAQRVNRQSKFFLYTPNGQIFQDLDLQGAAFTAFSRNHPVIATSGNRFVAVDTLLGVSGTPPVQIVTGQLTATNIADAKRFAPVYCIVPACSSQIPLIDRETINPDGSHVFHIAGDVAVSDDGQGNFLLAALQMTAQPDATHNHTLMPVNGESVTLKVVRSSNNSFTSRSDSPSVWSYVGTQQGLPAGSAQFVQCVPYPGKTDGSVLVLTVGPAGTTGWKISPSGASNVSIEPISPAALAAMFNGGRPSSQPFALSLTNHLAM